MRSLIRARIRRDDAGATLVLVSILMVVLLGMGALVIDVGQLYAERRELQNGADAAALAVAQDCAAGDCRDETTTAATYADDNAHDGQAGVDEVCGSGPGLAPCPTPPAGVPAHNWVKVGTVTPDDDKVDFVFASVLGVDDGGTSASAIATWGGLGMATTAPFGISICDYMAAGGVIGGSPPPVGTKKFIYLGSSGEQYECEYEYQDGNAHLHIQNQPGGTYEVESPTEVTQQCYDEHSKVENWYEAECERGHYHVKLRRGFTWFAPVGGSCVMTNLPAGGWAQVGAPWTDAAIAACASQWQNQEILIPIYDAVKGSGTNRKFQIAGFAGFKVLGYKLGTSASTAWNNTVRPPWGTGGNCPTGSGAPQGSAGSLRCVYGEFTRYVPTTPGPSGGMNFGAHVVEMIG